MPDARWSLTEYRGLEGFASVEAAWRQLYDEMPSARMWQSHEAYGAYLAHLCPDPDKTRWLALSDGQRVRQILPIEERDDCSFVERGTGPRVRVWGMPLCEGWSLPDAIGPEDDARSALIPAVLGHLRRQPERPALLVLGRTCETSRLWDGIRKSSPLTHYAFEDGGEFVLPTDMTRQEFLARLPKKTRNSMSRAQRLFDALPAPRVVRALTKEQMLSEYEQFLDVEASGWKGKHGSSIRQRAGCVAFYRELLLRLAHDGHCEVHSLYSDDRCIASAFYAYGRRECTILKSGYDEDFARVSPGKLRAHSAFLWCCDDPAMDVVSEVSDAPWLRVWLPNTNVMRRAYVSLRPISGPLLLAAFRLRYGPIRWATRAVKERRRRRDDRAQVLHGRDAQ